MEVTVQLIFLLAMGLGIVLKTILPRDFQLGMMSIALLGLSGYMITVVKKEKATIRSMSSALLWCTLIIYLLVNKLPNWGEVPIGLVFVCLGGLFTISAYDPKVKHCIFDLALSGVGTSMIATWFLNLGMSEVIAGIVLWIVGFYLPVFHSQKGRAIYFAGTIGFLIIMYFNVKYDILTVIAALAMILSGVVAQNVTPKAIGNPTIQDFLIAQLTRLSGWLKSIAEFAVSLYRRLQKWIRTRDFIIMVFGPPHETTKS